MAIARRSFITGVAALLATPAIVRTPGLLMPVRRVLIPDAYEMEVDFMEVGPNTVRWQHGYFEAMQRINRNGGPDWPAWWGYLPDTTES